MYIKKMDIDFQTHTPLSDPAKRRVPLGRCRAHPGTRPPAAQAPRRLPHAAEHACEGAWMADSGIAFLRERSPAIPHGLVSFQPGAVPALSLTCISAPWHLPPPQVSLSTLPRITNPRGSRQKTWIPGVKSVPHLFCLKKGRGWQ